jgi:hypothetical protein
VGGHLASAEESGHVSTVVPQPPPPPPQTTETEATVAADARAEAEPAQKEAARGTKGRRGRSHGQGASRAGGTPGTPAAPAGAAPAGEPIIDAEFAALVPPPSPDERAQLENNLLADQRCTAPLIVWKGPNLLLDGHTRLALCKQHGLPYKVVAIDLPDRAAALRWIIHHQLGRRNLTAEQASWLRGRRYLEEKQAHGGDRRSPSRGQAAHMKTAERLAKECRVDARTIRRDGSFAENVQKIAASCGEKAIPLLLSRQAKPTRRKVATLAALDPEEQRDIVEALAQGGKLTVPRPGQAAQVPRLNVPAEPEALAEAVLDKLGPQAAAVVQEALGRLLEAAKPAKARKERQQK